MSNSIHPESGKPIKSQPHLILKAKPGWKFDSSIRTFVSKSESENDVSAEQALPGHAEVEPRIPSARPDADNEAERDLAHFWNVLLSVDDDLEKIASSLRGLDCVEKVDFPPEVSLPGDS